MIRCLSQFLRFDDDSTSSSDDDDIHNIEIEKQVMRYVLLCALLCVIRIEVSALQVFHSASNWLTLGTLYFILT